MIAWVVVGVGVVYWLTLAAIIYGVIYRLTQRP